MERELKKGNWIIKIKFDEKVEDSKWRALKELRRKPDWAKFLLYIYINEPCTITELSDFASMLEVRDYDRSSVYNIVRRLARLGLVKWITPIDFLTANNPHDFDEGMLRIVTIAKKKYYDIIERLPDPIKKNKRLRNTNFIYTTNLAHELMDKIKEIVEPLLDGKIEMRRDYGYGNRKTNKPNRARKRARSF